MPDSAHASEATITVGEAAGEPYTLPVEDVLTGRLFVTGKSGSGKSNTGSVVAEELLKRGHPLLAVDVDGEYWGLKEAYEVLEARKLIEKDSRDDGMYVDLNTEGLNEVREAAARQRKTEQLMEEL